MNHEWEGIQSDYNKAKNALWSPQKPQGDWHRDRETGHYYMWKAHHRASEAEPKNELLYARILAMMASEHRFRVDDYALYHKYVKPSLDAYHRAIGTGQHPTEKELASIQLDADLLSYEIECREAPYEEHIRHLQGYEKLERFGIYDSKPLWFEHSEHHARLKLQYCELTATFLFEDVDGIHIDTDPVSDWITEFSCYPCFHNKDLFTFDIGFYRILCSEIIVESVEAVESESPVW